MKVSSGMWRISNQRRRHRHRRRQMKKSIIIIFETLSLELKCVSAFPLTENSRKKKLKMWRVYLNYAACVAYASMHSINDFDRLFVRTFNTHSSNTNTRARDARLCMKKNKYGNVGQIYHLVWQCNSLIWKTVVVLSQALAVAAAVTTVAMCAPSEFWLKTNWTKMWNVDVKWQRRLQRSYRHQR